MTQKNKQIQQISEIRKSFKSVIQMSYDIVKAHGGELKMETKQGEGSTFIIQLTAV